METAKSTIRITLIFVLVCLATQNARCDGLGSTKATRLAEKQANFHSGGNICAGHFENDRSNMETGAAWGLTLGIGFIPVIGKIWAGTITVYEGGRAAYRAYIEHTSWRCFYTQCLPRPAPLNVPFDENDWFEWLSNNVPGGMTREWINENKVTACYNYYMNSSRADQRCSTPNCFKPVEAQFIP